MFIPQKKLKETQTQPLSIVFVMEATDESKNSY